MTVDMADDLTDAWAAERSVMAALERHKVIDGTHGMGPKAFVLVAACIRQFKNRPVTDGDMEELKRRGCNQNRNRKTRHLAANILRSEIHSGQHSDVKRWKEAIAVLLMPRNIMDNPHYWLYPAEQGQAIKASSFMATEIAACLTQALKGYGVPVSLGKEGGMVAFIREMLVYIGLSKPPSPREISKVLKKNLPRM